MNYKTNLCYGFLTTSVQRAFKEEPAQKKSALVVNGKVRHCVRCCDGDHPLSNAKVEQLLKIKKFLLIYTAARGPKDHSGIVHSCIMA